MPRLQVGRVTQPCRPAPTGFARAPSLRSSTGPARLSPQPWQPQAIGLKTIHGQQTGTVRRLDALATLTIDLSQCSPEPLHGASTFKVSVE